MERHKCKLCLKLFANGRALGGHMRSHMLNLPHKQEDHRDDHHRCSAIQLRDGTESASSSEEEPKTDGEDEKGVCYELRENPKPSVRLVDPEFAFAVDVSSVVLQDRESETESSKNPTRRRSKRTRKLSEHHPYHHHSQIKKQDQENSVVKKLKFSNKTTESSWGHEPEPVSSISDATTEEDVAFCLMMLSRDKWKRKEKQNHREQDDLDDDDEDDDKEEEEETERSIEETDESDGFKSCKPRGKGKYRCETCNKVFKSYQALGGHRASHKKLKIHTSIQETELETRNNNNSNAVTPSSASAKRIHECPYCFRVFPSGQALGGHKRSHGLASATQTSHRRSSTTSKTEDNLNLIDLNLPAPVDDDDVSQVELSAVSDAEFVNHIKR